MRRFVVVLIVALMALTLVGCGGGAEEPPPAPEPGDAAAPLPPVVEEEDPDLSAVEEQVFVPFPVDPEVGVPSAIQSRLDSKQPMIILFYDDTQDTTEYQNEIIGGVLDKYRGLIDLVSFDVSRYVRQNEAGEITVDPAINEDELSKQVTRMLHEDNLDIRFTPFTIIVDEQAHVTWRYRGIADDKTLEREVLRVTE